MKSITFHLDNGKSIHTRDDSDVDLEVYTNELSQILVEPNVVTVNMSESNFIIRPSRIDTIEISECPQISEDEVTVLRATNPVEDEILKSATIQEHEESEKVEEKKDEEDEEDMITDGD